MRGAGELTRISALVRGGQVSRTTVSQSWPVRCRRRELEDALQLSIHLVGGRNEDEPPYSLKFVQISLGLNGDGDTGIATGGRPGSEVVGQATPASGVAFFMMSTGVVYPFLSTEPITRMRQWTGGLPVGSNSIASDLIDKLELVHGFLRR